MRATPKKERTCFLFDFNAGVGSVTTHGIGTQSPQEDNRVEDVLREFLEEQTPVPYKSFSLPSSTRTCQHTSQHVHRIDCIAVDEDIALTVLHFTTRHAVDMSLQHQNGSLAVCCADCMFAFFPFEKFAMASQLSKPRTGWKAQVVGDQNGGSQERHQLHHRPHQHGCPNGSSCSAAALAITMRAAAIALFHW